MFLDPDGTEPYRWSYVVVRHPTGVRYGQQYGGTANEYGVVEGYLVPVDAREAFPALDEVFLRKRRPADEVDRVREAVAHIRYWTAAGDATTPHPLRLDDERLGELDEAWVPVVTPDGPGVLVWPNSD